MLTLREQEDHCRAMAEAAEQDVTDGSLTGDERATHAYLAQQWRQRERETALQIHMRDPRRLACDPSPDDIPLFEEPQ